MSNKEEKERSVFIAFAKVEGIFGDGNDVKNGKPPEPDIIFSDSKGMKSSFELVEILDQGYASMRNMVIGFNEICHKFLRDLSLSEKEIFNSKYANADIFLSLCPSNTRQTLRLTIPNILKELLDLPCEAKGIVGANIGLLRPVTIYRTQHLVVGPRFNANLSMSVNDPAVSAIQCKMHKYYKTLHSLNLLAYVDINPMFPKDVWLSPITDFFATLDNTCQFEAIYIFDYNSNKVKRKWRKLCTIQ